ncbi:peptidoglycan editing factor PgeF [Terribacillus sp. DMT04]|uniref:peptidoglycan editing factor PgeF n=1 Tax=Terribacillus sp. DMT04 TaxID=2850441 RepID=UPI0020B839A4|nr:peptidoglycan editing factor PgeF [Terribacillus sp. DMT04]
MREAASNKQRLYMELGGWSAPNRIVSGITTKNNGVSKSPFDSLNMGLHVGDKDADVIQNRELLAGEIAFPLANWVLGEQVHGTEIAVVQKKDAGRGSKSLSDSIPSVDGLITNEPGLLLAAFFADCVPLYFSDAKTGWIGMAHAGWRGTVGDMAGKMIAALGSQGANPANIEAMIGPCISKHKYEVDDRIFQQIPERFRAQVLTASGESDKYYLDLQALNRLYLLDAGVKDAHIKTAPFCTYEMPEFYSHRQDQGKTGRMIGFIGMKEEQV